MSAEAASGEGDYFLFAEIPGGACYCYRYPGEWWPCSCEAPIPAYQGHLVELNDLEVFRTWADMLPVGTYRVHFAIDNAKDGRWQRDPAKEDVVEFTVGSEY